MTRCDDEHGQGFFETGSHEGPLNLHYLCLILRIHCGPVLPIPKVVSRLFVEKRSEIKGRSSSISQWSSLPRSSTFLQPKYVSSPLRRSEGQLNPGPYWLCSEWFVSLLVKRRTYLSSYLCILLCSAISSSPLTCRCETVNHLWRPNLTSVAMIHWSADDILNYLCFHNQWGNVRSGFSYIYTLITQADFVVPFFQLPSCWAAEQLSFSKKAYWTMSDILVDSLIGSQVSTFLTIALFALMGRLSIYCSLFLNFTSMDTDLLAHSLWVSSHLRRWGTHVVAW